MKGPIRPPASSPGRTDNFPPPLMRFLRSNAGSKSRGRSRSSPLFVRKKNSSAAIETTEEPSSPKVTCIGQVRVRKPSVPAGTSRPMSNRETGTSEQPCCWPVHGIPPKSLKLDSICSVLRKRVGFGCCKTGDIVDSPSPVESNLKANLREESGRNIDGDGPGSNSGSVAVGGGERASGIQLLLLFEENDTLLTRCRSAPYKSTSLASRFAEAEEEEPRNCSVNGESRENEEQEDLGEKLEGKEEKQQEIEVIRNKGVHPLLLTRCNSEPSRTGESLNPDAGYWRLRRFDDHHLQPES
ncbi:unnamed protein product [Cuscuta epithymum]|uniref:Uncharacterized protein n=1 Tax=Cuscuta epithymum TaxID=186058 RepID=A0AAV0F8A9_9ASTE|nr:unnamed protein product [Cuscuta epithymum]